MNRGWRRKWHGTAESSMRVDRFAADRWRLQWALTLARCGSCTNLPIATEDAKAPDVFDRIRALDLLPRSPQPEPRRPDRRPARQAHGLYRGRRSRHRLGARAPGWQQRRRAAAPGAAKATSSTSRTRRSRRSPRRCSATSWASAIRSTRACRESISLSSGKPVPKIRSAVRARKRPAHEQRRADPRRRRAIASSRWATRSAAATPTRSPATPSPATAFPSFRCNTSPPPRWSSCSTASRSGPAWCAPIPSATSC